MATTSSLGMGLASTTTRELPVSSYLSSSLTCFRRDVLGPNQACTIYGASVGSNIVSGYSLHASDLWKRCLVVLLAFTVVFQLTQVIALEFFPVCITDGGQNNQLMLS